MLARNNRRIVTIRYVTRTAVAMEQLSKYVSAGTNMRNNRGALLSLQSMPRRYKKDKEDRSSQSIRVG
jgi:hypothetical protein